MLRRNLLKNIVALIPIPFLTKNETKKYRNFLRKERSNGFWSEETFNENGQQIKYEDSNGDWVKNSYNEIGQELKYEDSNGYWSEKTYDLNGNRLTYKNNF